MGEIADMMLDGTLDCETGEYIGEPCGYPRTGNDASRREKPTLGQKRAAQRRRAKARKREAERDGGTR